MEEEAKAAGSRWMYAQYHPSPWQFLIPGRPYRSGPTGNTIAGKRVSGGGLSAVVQPDGIRVGRPPLNIYCQGGAPRSNGTFLPLLMPSEQGSFGVHCGHFNRL